LVSAELILVDDYRFYLNTPRIDVNSDSLYEDIMSLQADPGTCPVISVDVGGRFTVETPT
jgi:hypothetical protein